MRALRRQWPPPGRPQHEKLFKTKQDAPPVFIFCKAASLARRGRSAKAIRSLVKGRPTAVVRGLRLRKHNRHEAFREANFGAVVDAICGCVVVLASQFMDEDFHPKDYLLAGDESEEFQSALGEYFLVRYPDDWPESERYYFSWAGIMDEQDPFQNLAP
jgi:hypothetical protein